MSRARTRGAVPRVCAAIAIAAATSAAALVAQPTELAALLKASRIDAPVAASCRGEFSEGRGPGYAVAVALGAKGGRYLVLQPGAEAVELAAFTDGADLTCYSVDEAERMNAAIRESEGIHGQIRPSGGGTVVCGFVDSTTAACWQFDPATKRFVRAGGWIT